MTFSMDDVNKAEINLLEEGKVAVFFRKPLERWWKVKRFKQSEIDMALDYFNLKKSEGYETRIKKVNI